MAAGSLYARYRPPSRPDTAKPADLNLPIKASKQAKQSFDKHNSNGSASSEQHKPTGSSDLILAVPEQHFDLRRSKKRKRESSGLDHSKSEQDEQKNSNVLKKYQKATALGLAEDHSITEPSNGNRAAEVVLHDLVPLPQPTPAPEGPTISISSALPLWLSKPTLVSATSAARFETLGVDAEHLTHLSQYPEALAVQTGVLPLLLPRPCQHPGDLCVSAATGSGKTLAYVLPIVQSLKNRVCTRMRAIIVVPTRELVGQVERTVRECAAGTNLQAGIATGSQALATEQANLISKNRIYDPEAYHSLVEKLDNIARLDSDIFAEEADEQRINEDGEDLWPGFVPMYNSKVDILVCTPGRLVDHIKATHGFSLADLEWLVIDEADRLLDQSFQEWAEVVNDAIDQRAKPETATKVTSRPSFAALRPPKPRVRKVILSATMTRDLDRLALLKLWNPKLVLVEGAQDSLHALSATSLVSVMSLPPDLHECAVPVSTGADKPLYLLQILLGTFGNAATLGSTGKSRSAHKKTESSSDSGPSSDSLDGTNSSISDDKSSDSSGELESSEAQSMSSDDDSPASEGGDLHEPDMFAKHTLDNHIPTAQAAPKILIFTSSTESADRLSHLLSHLHPPYSPILDTLTKSSPAGSRSKLATLRSGRKRILIATDRASRGLDVPDLTQVINYDMPHSVTSYVHRVGRTARAGKYGEAWTLVEDREAGWFWNAIAKSPEIGRGDRKVARVRVDSNGQAFGEDMRTRYVDALQNLERDVKDSIGRPVKS